MATTLPRVTVTPSAGMWLVQCSTCGPLGLNLARPSADLAAVRHRGNHQRPDPRDHITETPTAAPAPATPVEPATERSA
ncbi:hypothetical protein [Nocardioides bruguierae]|uniref:hypothetical protein n=1 Tax=Nocardioides bruguierae TaxID=2945102 RepID=UPI0020202B07|nr:hypothetical protein [Nocardioides bruguierae]MCL8026340.1 hypothetical protein [Nocardioides bruguierae]